MDVYNARYDIGYSLHMWLLEFVLQSNRGGSNYYVCI